MGAANSRITYTIDNAQFTKYKYGLEQVESQSKWRDGLIVNVGNLGAIEVVAVTTADLLHTFDKSTYEAVLRRAEAVKGRIDITLILLRRRGKATEPKDNIAQKQSPAQISWLAPPEEEEPVPIDDFIDRE
jgi:hypothetical protein